MNRTTTVVVALIAAAGLSTMVYAVPEQRALAWGGCGGFGGCGGCGKLFELESQKAHPYRNFMVHMLCNSCNLIGRMSHQDRRLILYSNPIDRDPFLVFKTP
jgi:hypothetical protein